MGLFYWIIVRLSTITLDKRSCPDPDVKIKAVRDNVNPDKELPGISSSVCEITSEKTGGVIVLQTGRIASVHYNGLIR
jgi:hypothetical protein